MTSRVQSLRSSTKGARPPAGRAVGEIFTNFPDKQIGVVGPAGNIDLVPVRFFSETADYAIGDLVARGGDIYRAAVAITAGAWNGTQWTDIVHESDRHHGVTLFDASKGYLQNELVAYQGRIYRAINVVSAGAWDATKWADLDTTLVDAIRAFDATRNYAVDDLVWNAGKIYRAKVAGVNTWNAAYWEDININTPHGVTPFDATKAYAVGDMVTQAGAIYKATAIAPAGAFDGTKWTKIAGSLTAGSVPFADTNGALTEDNAALNFNKTRKQLGIGVVPTATDPLLTVNSDAKINGVDVGKGAGSGTGNTRIGAGSLAANTGSNNLALGKDAGKSIVGGSGNVVIGSAPGEAAMNNTVIIADGAGGEKCRFNAGGDFLVGTTTAFPGITNNSAGMYYQSAGSLIVSRPDDNPTLHLNRGIDGRIIMFRVAGVDKAGVMIAGTTASFAAVSDERLKENITDLPSQLDAIMAMRPVEFDWKDGSGHQIGFIAQEFEKVYPDCVTEREDGFKQISHWNRNEARLVSALQAAVKKIDALEARLAKLENK